MKIEYNNLDERNDIYNSCIEQGLIFIGEQNITEGNFLIFGTREDLEQELLESLKPSEKEVLMAEIELNIINLLLELEVI